jgi:hypothetical protein
MTEPDTRVLPFFEVMTTYHRRRRAKDEFNLFLFLVKNTDPIITNHVAKRRRELATALEDAHNAGSC